MQLRDIDKLAELARMEIPQAEKEKVLQDLSGILSYIEQIKEIAVADIMTDYPLRNVFREDEKVNQPEACTETLLREMPDTQDGFLKVQKIL
ncbi:Asp-tRNA(Asn)/Glu-tRNA(Gln) amidotransferase subunit GatC [Candidatus Nomurabacteria bacterium]|jgi:aspartyl-tRNA(Asn)/glutamyl-tRNA(Gln) amidotransferase subunit C|nr:MAG: Asp-tRNA(Asn)/Glu-tRNA(Gln) amidotransferase subunit GatC [Candidatus Nomurabacteria bacterium]